MKTLLHIAPVALLVLAAVAVAAALCAAECVAIMSERKEEAQNRQPQVDSYCFADNTNPAGPGVRSINGAMCQWHVERDGDIVIRDFRTYLPGGITWHYSWVGLGTSAIVAVQMPEPYAVFDAADIELGKPWRSRVGDMVFKETEHLKPPTPTAPTPGTQRPQPPVNPLAPQQTTQGKH